MTEFHVAIPDAVTHVQPLIQVLEEAQRECHDAIAHVQALGERLTLERQALKDAVAALQQGATDAEQAMAADVTEAAANLDKAKQVIELAAHEWSESTAKEDEALKAASELLPHLTEAMKAMGEKAHEASHAVLEWVGSVCDHIEHSVQSIEQAVGESLATAMHDWQHEAEAEVQRLLDFLEKECEHLIDTKEAEWKEKMPHALEMVDHAFETIESRDQEIAAYAAEQWEHLLKTHIDAAETEAHALADALSSLDQAVENWDGQLQVAAEMMIEHQDQAATGAGTLEHDFEELRTHWATFGVTC